MEAKVLKKLVFTTCLIVFCTSLWAQDTLVYTYKVVNQKGNAIKNVELVTTSNDPGGCSIVREDAMKTDAAGLIHIRVVVKQPGKYEITLNFQNEKYACGETIKITRVGTRIESIPTYRHWGDKKEQKDPKEQDVVMVVLDRQSTDKK